MVGVESDLLDVECLGSVDIGDRHSDKLEFHLHDWTLTVPTDTGGCILRVRFDSWTGRRQDVRVPARIGLAGGVNRA